MAVIVKAGSTVSTLMKEVYDIIQRNNMEVSYVTMEHCESLTDDSSQDDPPADIYVFEQFSGKGFDNARRLGKNIYGLSCLLECDHRGKSIPTQDAPLLSLAMRGLTISITGGCGPDSRADWYDKIIMMGGTAQKNFDVSVTHLVASEVGTKKYIVAADKNVPIMNVSWVPNLWRDSHLTVVNATDQPYAKMRCLPFVGLSITTSGLDEDDKMKIKAAVENGGGKYDGNLKNNECTHLVIENPEGQKYEFAKRSKIEIVTPAWVSTSVSTGYSLPGHDFPVKLPQGHRSSRMATSTPARSNRTGADISMMHDVSAIDTTHVNETIVGANNESSRMIQIDRTRSSAKDASLLAAMQIIDDIDKTSLPVKHMFLDNCKIFLCGFNSSRCMKLQKMISKAGGLRSPNINESLTHIVVGARNDQIDNQLQNLDFSPAVVKIMWLIHSYQNSRLLPEDNYLIMDHIIDVTEVEDSKFGIKTTKKVYRKKISVGEPVSNVSTNLEDMEDCDRHLQEVLSQYGNSSIQEMETTIKDKSTEVAEKTVIEPASISLTTLKTPARQERTVCHQSQESDLFVDLSFSIIGFNSEDSRYFQELIVSNRGKVLPSRSRGVPNYCIVPLLDLETRRTCDALVTMTWLNQCIEESRICQPHENELFTPFAHKNDDTLKPLDGCVISISGFECEDKYALTYIATHLGAIEQDRFVKSNAPIKKLRKSTHLIINQPIGGKYEASMKWKLPAVSKYWLFECLEKGRKLPETKYLISDTESFNKAKNSRITMLIDESKPITPCTPEMDTPSKFLGPKLFLPKYDITGMLEALQTPEEQRKAKGTPINEAFTRNMDIAMNRYMDKDLIEEYTDGSPAFKKPTISEKLKLNTIARRPSTPTTPIDTDGMNILQAAQSKPLRKRLRLSEDKLEISSEMPHRATSAIFHAPPIQASANSDIAESQPCEVTWNHNEGSDGFEGNTLPDISNRETMDGESMDTAVLEQFCDNDEETGGRDNREGDSDGDDDDDDAMDNIDVDTPDNTIEDIQQEVKPKLLFQFSGVDEMLKVSLMEIIVDLGGEISEENCFDNQCTHLLCDKPSRTEKYLASLAAGKWILHRNYLNECKEQGKFVDPEPFEWGSSSSVDNLPSINKNQKPLASAAHRCRKNTQEQKLRYQNTQNPNHLGAFSEWNVVLLVDKRKESGFKRLLEAGGATIQPYDVNTLNTVTHAFINDNSPNPVDLPLLKSYNILSLKPDYIITTLLDNSSKNNYDAFLFVGKK